MKRFGMIWHLALVVALGGFIGYLSTVKLSWIVLLMLFAAFGGILLFFFDIAFCAIPALVILTPAARTVWYAFPNMSTGFLWIIALVALGLVRRKSGASASVPMKIPVWWYIGVTMMILSWLVSLMAGEQEFAYGKPWFILPWLIPPALVLVPGRLKPMKKSALVWGLLIPILAAAGFGILQYYLPSLFTMPAYVRGYLPATDVDLRVMGQRALSTFGNPNTFAIALVLGVIVIQGAAKKNASVALRGWLGYALLLVLTFGIVLARSRTGLIMVGLVLIDANLLSLRSVSSLLRAVVVALGICLLVWVTPTDVANHILVVQNTVDARLDLANQAFFGWLQHPILGAGPYADQGIPVDNFYLAILLKFGMLGFVAIAGLYYNVGRILYGNRHETWGWIMWRWFLVLLFANLSGEFILNDRLSPLLWWGVGLVMLTCARGQSLEGSNGGEYPQHSHAALGPSVEGT